MRKREVILVILAIAGFAVLISVWQNLQLNPPNVRLKMMTDQQVADENLVEKLASLQEELQRDKQELLSLKKLVVKQGKEIATLQTEKANLKLDRAFADPDLKCARGHPTLLDASGPMAFADPDLKCAPSKGCIPEKYQLENKLKVSNLKPSTPFVLIGSGDIVSNSIIRSGGWEWSRVNTFIRFMEECSSNVDRKNRRAVFVDIGANLGSIAIPVARNGHTTYAFEPLDYNVVAMLTTKGLNPSWSSNLQVYHTGLGDEIGNCRIISGKTNAGDGIVNCGASMDAPVPPDYVVRQSLPVRLLDVYFNNEEFWRDNFICAVKIDVEGFESKILAGGHNTLLHRGIPVIHAETLFNQSAPSFGINSRRDFFKKFLDAGYVVTLDGYTEIPENRWEGQLFKGTGQNEAVITHDVYFRLKKLVDPIF